MSEREWLDRVAYGIERTAADLRRALRALAMGEPDPLIIPGMRMLRIAPHQARALLHACMPAQIAASGGRRQQHARTIASLVHAGRAMVALHDTNTPRATETAIGAMQDLREQLGEWMRRARWQQATTLARVAWPPPVGTIRAVIPPALAEQHANTPSAAAGRARHPAAALDLARSAGRRFAAPDQLALPLPAPAAPIDLRQLRLQLAA